MKKAKTTAYVARADVKYSFQDLCFADIDYMHDYIVDIRMAFENLRATPNSALLKR